MKEKVVTRTLFLASGALLSLCLFAQSEKRPSQKALLDEKATGVYITFADTYTSDF